ncbi:SCP-like extracellular protein [Caloranaerobacter sp. TR13]|uniref:CAP domain-containing protein n=1 Tax=Caloranaerobacter sp. TR13 TaxID=1302151 RepID=UPI0006D45C2B|nr:CAP domain-containing protein [Caloranaerobacter sp. TR13]KPU27604.1 SCP-like extracellular protein [Caloranaerobacter sp. TR13]
MKKTFAILLILTLFLVSCTAPSKKPIQMQSKTSSIFDTANIENIKITVDDCNVRSGKGTNFPVVAKLKKGDIVDVIGKFGNWYVVKLPNNKVGCVASDNAKPVVVENEEKQVKEVYRLTDEEQRMVTLINNERIKRNLKPLQVDKELTRVARIKSQDMEKNDYFSHYSPTYGSPFDMMKSFGIKFLAAGENIAANRSIENAHNSFMNSKGHRDNILNPNFTHIGVGIEKSSKYGNLITEMFISKPK